MARSIVSKKSSVGVLALALLGPSCGSSDDARSPRDEPDGAAGNGGSAAGGRSATGGNPGTGGRGSGGARPGAGGTPSTGGAGTGGAGSGGVDAGAGGVDAGAGGSDAGGLDAGAGGSAGDASVEAGPPDASPLPVCTTGDASPRVSGLRADVFSEGNLLAQPNAMVFGSDGKLYVSNSRSFLTTNADQGEILVLDSSGAQSVYFTHNLLRGPDALAFADPGDTGGQGPLIIGVEDGDEALVHPNDYFLRVVDGTPTIVIDSSEPVGMLKGPGGAFGSDLYYTSRTTLQNNPPNELRLFRTNGQGAGSVFTVTGAADGGAEITGAVTLDWARGGALGTALYLGTMDDALYSPGSIDAVYRVEANGSATLLVSAYVASALAASPSPSGPFGDYLYAARRNALERIDSAGNVTPVLNGLSDVFGMVFGPDGILYVSDSGTSRIWTVRPCAD